MEAGDSPRGYCCIVGRNGDSFSVVQVVGFIRHGCCLVVLKTEYSIFTNGLNLGRGVKNALQKKPRRIQLPLPGMGKMDV